MSETFKNVLTIVILIGVLIIGVIFIVSSQKQKILKATQEKGLNWIEVYQDESVFVGNQEAAQRDYYIYELGMYGPGVYELAKQFDGGFKLVASRDGISQIDWMSKHSGEEYKKFWEAVQIYSKYNKKVAAYRNFDDLLKKKGKLIDKLTPYMK